MKSGVCLCVLVAALAAGTLAQPVPPPDPEGPGAQRDEEAPRRQLRAVQRVDGEPSAHLGALLARYIQQARKGAAPYYGDMKREFLNKLLTQKGLPDPFNSLFSPSGRTSMIKNLQSRDPSHRISDRDYMGWMDFGRRSAEEYEYPS